MCFVASMTMIDSPAGTVTPTCHIMSAPAQRAASRVPQLHPVWSVMYLNVSLASLRTKECAGQVGTVGLGGATQWPVSGRIG